MKTKLKILAIVALGTLSAHAFSFDFIFTEEHVDIGIAYENGAWDLHVHDEDNDVEWEPDDALFYVGANGKAARPSGSQWDFLGTSAGSDVWIIPQTQATNLPFLGIAGEEIDFGIFDNNQVQLFLRDVRGNGDFAIYNTDSFGTPQVRFSSANGFDNTDVINVPVGGHAHYNFAFTSTGLYEVDLEAVGFINGVQTNSLATYHFGVEAVPEPATMTVLGLGALAVLRKRKQK